MLRKNAILALGVMAIAMASAAGAQTQAPKTVPLRVIDVREPGGQILSYRHLAASTEVHMRGTRLAREAQVKLKIGSRPGFVEMDINRGGISGLKPAYQLGKDFLTYVLWAVSVDGRASNLGEVTFDGDRPVPVNVTTPYQTFWLMVTAEPNYAVVESPYFVIKSGGYAVLEDLHKRGVRVRVLTNSLASTDASYAVAALYPRLDSLADTGLTLSAYGGAALPSQSTNLRGGTPRWGVHSKRGVIDGDTTLVGTYNVDPRSANLNSELMLVCRGQKDLAAEVLASIAAREAGSVRVIERGTIVERSALLGRSSLTHRIRFLVEMPIANLFDFLL
jgi:hypothetical protein